MNTKKIFSNTTYQIIARVVSSGVGFLIALLVARSFGIIGYANVAKITAFVGLLYLFVDLGMNAIFLQLEKDMQQFSQFLSFRLLLAFLLFIAVLIVIFLLPYNDATTSGYPQVVKIGIFFLSFSFFSRAIVYSTTVLFQKNLAYEKAAYATISSSIVTLGIVVIAVLLRTSILWIIAGYVAGGFVESFLSLILAKEKFLFAFPRKAFMQQMLFPTIPLAILLFFNLIYFRIDMVLLSFFQKATSVGLYDFAYKFFDFFIALPLFLSNVLYPGLLLQEKNSRIQRKNVAAYLALFFFLGAILVPLIWIFSPLLQVVKQEFAGSIIALRILSLSLPIFFATSILQWIFIAKKKQRVLVFVYAFSLIGNVLLNILFIPQYSYIASAVITGVSELFVFFAMMYYVFLKHI